MKQPTANLLELVWVRSLLNLKSEIARNRLAYSWWIIEPLLHMGAYYFVFAILLNRGGDNYAAFLLSGLIPWLWFSRSINKAMNSIDKGAPLIAQLFVAKIFFPLTALLQDGLKQLIVFPLLLIFLFSAGTNSNSHFLWLVPVIIAQACLILGTGLLIAFAVPFVRDLANLIPTCLQFTMFCSGIFYSHEEIPSHIRDYFFWNPIAAMLEMYREILVDGRTPSLSLMVFVGLLGLTLTVISACLYRRYEYQIARVALEG